MHFSVVERIQGDSNYRPKSLPSARYEVIYRDGAVKEYLDFPAYKNMSRRNLITPDEDGTETRIYAHLRYNHTGIYLEAGQPYLIEVINKAKQKWRDGSM